jgi:hypothetical protein
VKIGSTEEHDAYIHLAIHREISLVINNIAPSKSKVFFKYDKKLFSETCASCYKNFSYCDFFDCKWTDSFVQTLQKKNSTSDEMECFICGDTTAISKVECDECGNFSVSKSTKECTATSFN